MKTTFSIVLPAYKEENLSKLTNFLLKEKTEFELEKIIIVACGYSNELKFSDKKIDVIKERERKGKASAINLALEKISSDIVIVESSDTLPKKGSIEKLLKPFSSPEVGMTTGRPIPIDSKENFIGFFNHLVWLLHHLVSLDRPKVGEIMAFRKIIEEIPKKLATDESYLESIFQKKGYKIVYIPDAVINNKGIEDLRFLIKQRRRYFNGHLHIKKEYDYTVSTMSIKRIFMALIKYFEIKSLRNYKEFFWIFCAVCLETFSRILGTLDFYLFNKIPYKWEMIKERE
jgi:poly-beta-1,6-N-acetyl-D-glucosamine synthase